MRWWAFGLVVGSACASSGDDGTSVGEGGSSGSPASSSSAADSSSATSTSIGSNGTGIESSSSDADGSSSGGAPECYYVEQPGMCPDEPPVMFECGGTLQCPELDLYGDAPDPTCVFTGLRDRTPGLYRVSGLAEGWSATEVFEVLADGTAIVHSSFAIDFSCGTREQWVDLADASVFDACLGVTDYLALLDCVDDFEAGCHLGEPTCPPG